MFTDEQIKTVLDLHTPNYIDKRCNLCSVWPCDAHMALTDLLTVREALEGEALAKRFHEVYERLAPDFGYETRRESAVPWEQVPEQNRDLMVAVCDEIARTLLGGD